MTILQVHYIHTSSISYIEYVAKGNTHIFLVVVEIAQNLAFVYTIQYTYIELKGSEKKNI